jgi:leukotriene-A4 hydrolase
MKYCRPVFRLLYKQAPELARKTFLEHQGFYVSIGIFRGSDLTIAPDCEEDDPARLGPRQGLMKLTVPFGCFRMHYTLRVLITPPLSNEVSAQTTPASSRPRLACSRTTRTSAESDRDVSSRVSTQHFRCPVYAA